jgi:hypothetical protein
MTDSKDNHIGSSLRVIEIDAESAKVLVATLESEGYVPTSSPLKAGTTHRDPLTAIFLAGSVALITLARVTVMVARSMARGAIVDTSHEDLIVRSDRNLPRGTIIVRNRHGDVQLHETDQGSFSKVVEQLTEQLSTRSKT